MRMEKNADGKKINKAGRQVSSPRFADTSFASRFFELFTLPASLIFKAEHSKEKCTKYACI